MPNEWISTLVSMYNNKGDIQNCKYYRLIKLMTHTMKLWERIAEQKLSHQTNIREPVWFYGRKSTIEAISILRRLIEVSREEKRSTNDILI